MDKGVRVRWRSDAIKCFLETCIQEVNKVGRRGSSLQRKSWAEVKRQLDEVCNMKVTQKQMRNLYDYLKERYAAWLYLREKSGDLYDPRTNTFNLSRQMWEEFLKGHPKVLSLKKSQLAFPDLCAALFVGVTGTHRLHVSSSRENENNNVQDSRSRASDSSLNSEESRETNGQDSQNIQPLRMVPIPRENENSNGQHSESRASDSSVNSEASRETTSDFNQDKGGDELIIKALKAITESSRGPSVKECVEKLNKIGLENTSPTYLAAFGIFTHSVACREAWLLLPSEAEVLKGWITMMGTSLGFLN